MLPSSSSSSASSPPHPLLPRPPSCLPLGLLSLLLAAFFRPSAAISLASTSSVSSLKGLNSSSLSSLSSNSSSSSSSSLSSNSSNGLTSNEFGPPNASSVDTKSLRGTDVRHPPTFLQQRENLKSSQPKKAEDGDFEFFGWTLHHIGGALFFMTFFLFVLYPVPIINLEWSHYNEYLAGGQDSFVDYIRYRFTDWFTTIDYAPSLVLMFLTMALIVFGSASYAVFVGESPAHAVWRIFVWASGSPAEGEVTPSGRFLGIIVTVCGMIILSLLFGIVTEVFSTKMRESKMGLQKVVEGGHVVILGYTDCTRCMVEELASARESASGGTFVLLARQKKEDIDKELFGRSLDLRNSRLIVRSGNPCYTRDLEKVAVQCASEVVVLSNTSLSPEEADAQTVRIILALKGQNWPTKGRIVVQCANPVNKDLFLGLYPDKVEVVVVGKIVTKLMAQSSQQHGLAAVFSMMLGFEGDEFYAKEWPELVGLSFREVFYRFPDAISLGVFTAAGKCILNPGWNYTMKEGDQLIVLAEDDDAYEPVEEPYYDFEDGLSMLPTRSRSKEKLQTALLRERSPSQVLIVGWNSNIGPLLVNLDEMLCEGSRVLIHSGVPVSEREASLELLKRQQNGGKGFVAISIECQEVEPEFFSSKIELQKLQHWNYNKIFLLAEVVGPECDSADEKTVAVLAQLQVIHNQLSDDKKGKYAFDPVVEMCEDSTREHLKLCGFTNFVHSSSLVSQALAAVTEEPKVNAIYADLMSGLEHSFDIRDFSDFLPIMEELPTSISFGEAAWKISLTGNTSLLAWSKRGETGEVEWEMNPTDKVSPREWTPEDRVVVLRRFATLED